MSRLFALLLLLLATAMPTGHAQLGDILNDNFGVETDDPDTTANTSSGLPSVENVQDGFDMALKVVGVASLAIAVIALLTGSILTSIMFFVLFGVCLWLFQSEPLLGLEGIFADLIDTIKGFIQAIIDESLFGNNDTNNGNITQ